MLDYQVMYRKLFNIQTDAIELLQKAQQKTEPIYIDSTEPNIVILNLRIQMTKHKKTQQQKKLIGRPLDGTRRSCNVQIFLVDITESPKKRVPQPLADQYPLFSLCFHDNKQIQPVSI